MCADLSICMGLVRPHLDHSDNSIDETAVRDEEGGGAPPSIRSWMTAMVMSAMIMTVGPCTGYGVMYGSKKNGRTLQGPQLAERVAAGDLPMSELLHGPQLIGTLEADGEDVAIVSFHGDHVIADKLPRGGSDRRAIRLDSERLVGMRWTEKRCVPNGECVEGQFRITDVAVDRTRNTMLAHGSNRDLRLYTVEMAKVDPSGASAWENICGAYGVGIFVDGQWNNTGAWSVTGYTFSCSTGVITKCVRSWGYKPWKTLRTSTGLEVDVQPLHEACVRAARADYRGDGVSHTQEGVWVAITDVYGLNTKSGGSRFTLEAAFDKDGASRVWRKRLPTKGPTDPFAGSRLPGGRWRRDAANDEGRLMFVWSKRGR